MRHGVLRIERQRLSQHLLGFLVAILGQQGACLAQTAEARFTSSCRCAAKTTDSLVSMAQGVSQRAGPEPRLGQSWDQLSGMVIRNDCSADIAQLLQGNSHAEICIAIAGIAVYSPLQCGDGVWYTANLKVGQAEIVLD